MSDIKQIEKDIKSCIYSALSKSNINIFESLNDVFKTHFEKPCNNIIELRRKTTRQKGLFFEVFCKLFLQMRGYDDVWLLNEIPPEILKYLNMESYDVGIDLVARFKIPNKETLNLEDYFYVCIQAKYRKPSKDTFGREVHRVSWKELSTFLSLTQRTGPTKYGWKTKIVMTNADNVSWRGKKADFKVKTYAKKTFEKITRQEWLKIVGNNNGLVKSEGYNLGSGPSNLKKKIRRTKFTIIIDSSSESESDEELKEFRPVVPKELLRAAGKETEFPYSSVSTAEKENIPAVKELRLKWLDRLKL